MSLNFHMNIWVLMPASGNFFFFFPCREKLFGDEAEGGEYQPKTVIKKKNPRGTLPIVHRVGWYLSILFEFRAFIFLSEFL